MLAYTYIPLLLPPSLSPCVIILDMTLDTQRAYLLYSFLKILLDKMSWNYWNKLILLSTLHKQIGLTGMGEYQRIIKQTKINKHRDKD